MLIYPMLMGYCHFHFTHRLGPWTLLTLNPFSASSAVLKTRGNGGWSTIVVHWHMQYSWRCISRWQYDQASEVCMNVLGLINAMCVFFACIGVLHFVCLVLSCVVVMHVECSHTCTGISNNTSPPLSTLHNAHSLSPSFLQSYIPGRLLWSRHYGPCHCSMHTHLGACHRCSSHNGGHKTDVPACSRAGCQVHFDFFLFGQY